MFKEICAIIVGGSLLFNVAFAQNSVSTDQDLLNIIKQLQAQIQSLRAQIADLQSQVQSVKIELNFSRALAKGASGDDVKQLQEFLKNFPDVYPEGLVTGYFGPLTEGAVKKFQEQNGIESVGIVGPKTQAKLNELVTTGAGQSSIIPPAITSTGGSAPSAPPDIVPAVPAIPATSATPATPSTPAVPATPATPASPGSSPPPSSPPTPPPSPTPLPETPTDTTAPSAPTNLSAAAISSSQIDISWMSSTDNIGVVGYKIYRGGVQIATIVASVASTTSPFFYSNTGLQASTAYTYTVVAYDAAGNEGVQSTGVSATTQSPQPPSAPITVTYPNGGEILGNLNISIYFKSNNINAFGFKLLKDSQVVYETPSAFSLIVPLSYPLNPPYVANLSAGSNGTYGISFPIVGSILNVTSGNNYKIRVFDWNHPEIYDDSDHYFSYDTSPPIASSVLASSITANSAVITWTTDEPATGFVNYGSAPSNWVITPTNTFYTTSHSFILSNLTSSTPYTFRVYSNDALGNGPGLPPAYTFTTLSGPVSCSGINLTLNDGKTTYIKGVDNLVNFSWACVPGGSANVSIILQKPGALGQVPLATLTTDSSPQVSSINISGDSYPMGAYDVIACFNTCGSTVAQKTFNIQ